MTETAEPAPVVEVDMLIRRPAHQVYEAFADPERGVAGDLMYDKFPDADYADR